MLLSGVAIFEASASNIFHIQLHVKAQLVAYMLITPMSGYIVGCYLANKLSSCYNIDATFVIGIITALVGCFSLLIPTMIHVESIPAILIPMIIYMLGVGIVLPTAATGSTNVFGHCAGIVGAILGGGQNLVAGLLICLLYALPQTSQLTLAAFLLAGTLISYLSYLLCNNKINAVKEVLPTN